MGKEGEFDAWLERALLRELGWIRLVPPTPRRVATARRSRVRLKIVTGTGGALAIKAAGGFAAAAFALGATATAMTGSTNPVTWSQAIEEAAVSALPPLTEETPAATPAADDGQSAGPPAAVTTPAGGAPNSLSMLQRHPVTLNHRPKANPTAHDGGRGRDGSDSGGGSGGGSDSNN